MDTVHDHPGKGTAASGMPTDEMVRQQLERILVSAMFSNSQHLQHFLQYVSEQALAGHNDEITEYLIAARVFSRGDAFDPGSNTVVRTQAYRLRTKLKEYYETAGSEDPAIIDIPKGRYIPTFTLRNGSHARHAEAEAELPPAAAKKGRSWRVPVLIMAQMAVVALAALVGWALRGRVVDTQSDA